MHHVNDDVTCKLMDLCIEEIVSRSQGGGGGGKSGQLPILELF